MHADISDQATEQEERDRAVAVSNARRHAATPIIRTGLCHWCEAEINKDGVYCDLWCMADHAKALEAVKRNGLRLPIGR